MRQWRKAFAISTAAVVAASTVLTGCGSKEEPAVLL